MKKMIVKTSKAFCEVLEEEIAKNPRFAGYKLRRISMSAGAYSWYATEPDGLLDFDPRNDLYNVIKVDYPADFYALPLYVTTAALTRIFRKSNRTFDGFIKDFENYIEI